MEKPAANDYPIDDLLRRRWSPRAFAETPVPADVLRSLFEAARWAASSNNEQPWRFLVAAKDDAEGFEKLLHCLNDRNQHWAKAAPVLALSVAKKHFANGSENRVALHDVGQAAASLTVEATARGIVVHQMAGFDREKAAHTFSIPDDYEPVAAIALGYPGDPETLPDDFKEREKAPRHRKPISEFVYAGVWGQPAPLTQG